VTSTYEGRRIDQPHLVLVEGEDDVSFFQELIAFLQLPGFQVWDTKGKYGFRADLSAVAKDPHFHILDSLGIARDNDDDPAGTERSIRGALADAGLSLPSGPLASSPGTPTIVYTTLPRPGITGEIEDLCLEAVADSPELTCVHAYFACLSQQGVPSPHDLSKAKVQTFLASKADLTSRPGQAARKGYWSWSSPAFDQLARFARLLADPSAQGNPGDK